MTKEQILALTGLSEDQFYDMYPDQETFCADYPDACAQLQQSKNGGGIHINPANKGKFTASANRADMGVQEFASHVLANKEDYSSTQVKRANFARNASKWKHEEGGEIEQYQRAGQVNRPSTQDSLILHINQLQKDRFYKNNPDYEIAENAFTQNSDIPKIISDLRNHAYKVYTQDINDGFRTNKSQTELERRFGKIPNGNNVYSAGDIVKGKLNGYFNPSAPPSYFSNEILPAKWNTYLSRRFMDASDVPMYDAIALKPAVMKTVADWAYMEKTYGKPDSKPTPPAITHSVTPMKRLPMSRKHGKLKMKGVPMNMPRESVTIDMNDEIDYQTPRFAIYDQQGNIINEGDLQQEYANGGSANSFQQGGAYTVKPNDTLSAIAAANKMSLPYLLSMNPQFRENPNLIHVGDRVMVETPMQRSNREYGDIADAAVNKYRMMQYQVKPTDAKSTQYNGYTQMPVSKTQVSPSAIIKSENDKRTTVKKTPKTLPGKKEDDASFVAGLERAASNALTGMYNTGQEIGESMNQGYNMLSSYMKDMLYRTQSGVSRFIAKNDNDLKETHTSFVAPVASPVVQQTPPIILGDTIPLDGNIPNRYIIPAKIDLNRTKWGYRNRGDYNTIENTLGADLTLFNDFEPAQAYFKRNTKTPEDASFVGIDKNGNIQIGNTKDFANRNDLMISRTTSNDIIEFGKDQTGKLMLKNSKPQASNRHLSPITVVRKPDGTLKYGSLNLLIPKGNKDTKSFGNITGGRLIYASPDMKEKILVSGSPEDLDKSFNEFKAKGSYPYVKVFTLDNGTYGPGLRTKSGKITGEDLRKYQGANSSGSVFAYMLPGQEVLTSAQIRNQQQKPAQLKYKDVSLNTPNIRTVNDESYKKGHPLENSQEAIILHHTGYSDTTGMSKGYSNAMRGVAEQFSKKGESSHVVIDFDGTRYNFAKPSQVTFHAGKSKFKNRENVNDFGIGIEFQGDTDKRPLTDAQIESFVEYIAPIIKTKKIPLENIITHKQIRKDYMAQHPEDKDVHSKPDVNERDYIRILQTLKKRGLYETGGDVFPAMKTMFRTGGYYGYDGKWRSNKEGASTYVPGGGYYFQPGGPVTDENAPGTQGGSMEVPQDQQSSLAYSNPYSNTDQFSTEGQAYGEENYQGNPSTDKPAFSQFNYDSKIDPSTGFKTYSRKGENTPYTNIKKQDEELWNSLKDKGHGARWETGQTDIQRFGRRAGMVGSTLGYAGDVADMTGSFIANRKNQASMNTAAMNMGSTANIYNNPQAASKGDYGVSGSAYGAFRPYKSSNMSYKGMYGKYGMEVPKYAVGGFEPDFETMPVESSVTRDYASNIPFYEMSKMYNEPTLQNTRVQSDNTRVVVNNPVEKYKGAPAASLPNPNAKDVATKLNNPGNIIYAPVFSKMFGATKSPIKQTDGNGYFAAFPDLKTGLRAREVQLFGEVDGIFQSNYYNPDTDIHYALKKWSGGVNKDGSINNKGYGVEIYPELKGKTLAQITPAQRAELTKRQIKAESGSMYKLLKSQGIFKRGGQLGGQVVEMDDDEIQQFLAAGGQLEFLD